MSHTIQVLLGGMVLLAAIYGLAKWRGWAQSSAFWGFAVLWAVISAINLWVGVAHAGYSVAEEAPIFGLVFGIPTLAAWLLMQRKL